MRRGFLNREHRKDKANEETSKPSHKWTSDSGGTATRREPVAVSSNDIGITTRGFLKKDYQKQSNDAHISTPVASVSTASSSQNKVAKVIPIPSRPIHTLPTPSPGLIKTWGITNTGSTSARVAYFPLLPGLGYCPGVCLFPSGLKEALESMPDFPSLNPSFMRPDIVYEIRNSLIPNAGVGMFATEDLDVGDMIIMEYPFLSQPQETPYVPGPNSDPDMFMRALFRRLPQEGQDIFWSLHNCKPIGPSSKMKGIFDTNGLPMDLRPGDPVYVGLSKNISRINHSCVRNAQVTWSLQEWSWRVWALQPIKKGDEITISYVPPDLPRLARQQILRDNYSISSCICSCCSLPPALVKQSDENRIRLNHYTPPQWYMDGLPDIELEEAARDLDPDYRKLKEIIIESTMWMELMDQEKCWIAPVTGFHSQRLVKAWSALGPKGRSMAVKMARRAQVLERACLGMRSDGGWEAVLRDIEASDWWDKARRV
ncbi:hypothetical protein BDN72DRAFT_836904 [Pluteus cervinus]|uniref:Uncharacterized protein n=1 Tax=Pluteus cervinus TaxID=181527 RepID=A0ACD3B4U0_9AGAR|nr:hypothetical protein BDN72DRAFT_836904 [Pluteus cervinus]